MNEQHFADKVRQHLNRGLHQLPTPTMDRLATARAAALAAQKQAVNQTILATVGSFVQHHFENLRIRQMLVTLALAGCVVSSAFWLSDAHIAEQGEIDSQLLADDLPIGAFTDKGFAAWLNPASQD
ncbi:MAG: DUF3619 family protein [Propionivibrio sp.]